jgi:predicted RNase H-like nuclease
MQAGDLFFRRNVMKAMGIDGCAGGWFSVILSDDGWSASMYQTVKAIYLEHCDADIILIDIPIGLQDEGPHERSCDLMVRRLLSPPRASSVFPVPCRASVYEDSYTEASRINREKTGRGLSKQSFAISPKIREVDQFLRENLSFKSVLMESHPELCFSGLQGSPMKNRKKTPEGLEDRLDLLSQYYPQAMELFYKTSFRFSRRSARVASDDIVDALALAVCAYIGKRYGFETVPPQPPLDSSGLPMQMVYVRPVHQA